MPDEPDSSEAADMAVLKSHAAQLGEHFDTVQIFVTRHDPSKDDGTVSAFEGTGNWFARYGQVRNWLLKEERKDDDGEDDEPA